MRVLDLFCGAGGAAQGYHDAGLTPKGVDVLPQPDYPFTFLRGNVLHLPISYLRKFDLVHASPPCQKDAAITRGTNKHLRETYPDLIGPVRELLEASGVPYVIENPAARPDVVLCGEMFGLGVIRHRRFELGGWATPQPVHKTHRGRVRGFRHGKFYDGPYVAAYGQGGGKATVAEMQTAMGIDWTDNHKSLREAIPPAYTRWIAERFIEWKESTS